MDVLVVKTDKNIHLFFDSNGYNILKRTDMTIPTQKDIDNTQTALNSISHKKEKDTSDNDTAQLLLSFPESIRISLYRAIDKTRTNGLTLADALKLEIYSNKEKHDATINETINSLSFYFHGYQHDENIFMRTNLYMNVSAIFIISCFFSFGIYLPVYASLIQGEPLPFFGIIEKFLSFNVPSITDLTTIIIFSIIWILFGNNNIKLFSKTLVIFGLKIKHVFRAKNLLSIIFIFVGLSTYVLLYAIFLEPTLTIIILFLLRYILMCLCFITSLYGIKQVISMIF